MARVASVSVVGSSQVFNSLACPARRSMRARWPRDAPRRSWVGPI